MNKTLAVVGFGPGISSSVARKFGSQGFSVALVGRNAKRLASGVEALQADEITAAAFPADAGIPSSIQEALRAARGTLGPIGVLLWNAFGGSEARDLLTADAPAVQGLFDIPVTGLLAATQEILPDLRDCKGSVLVTNGSAGEIDPQTDAFVCGSNAMGLKMMGVAIANAAKNKLVGMLAERLTAEGVYVGQLTVAGTVKGTSWETPNSIDPSAISDRYWGMHEARDTVRVRMTAS